MSRLDTRFLLTCLVLGYALFFLCGGFSYIRGVSESKLPQGTFYFTATAPLTLLLYVTAFLGLYLMVSGRRFVAVQGRRAFVRLTVGFVLVAIAFWMVDWLAFPNG